LFSRVADFLPASSIFTANLTETEHTSSFWALIVFSELRDPQLSKQQTVAQHQQKVSPGTVATNECL
ncbi:hypothetical protein CHARACLAT_033606, partial [Characodon lateralis]|nr:hypothetical protein [Characodon lateralis]